MTTKTVKKYLDEWENGSNIQRLHVPGGWLVRSYSDDYVMPSTFVPDPKHEWILFTETTEEVTTVKSSTTKPKELTAYESFRALCARAADVYVRPDDLASNLFNRSYDRGQINSIDLISIYFSGRVISNGQEIVRNENQYVALPIEVKERLHFLVEEAVKYQDALDEKRHNINMQEKDKEDRKRLHAIEALATKLREANGTK